MHANSVWLARLGLRRLTSVCEQWVLGRRSSNPFHPNQAECAGWANTRAHLWENYQIIFCDIQFFFCRIQFFFTRFNYFNRYLTKWVSIWMCLYRNELSNRWCVPSVGLPTMVEPIWPIAGEFHGHSATHPCSPLNDIATIAHCSHVPATLLQRRDNSDIVEFTLTQFANFEHI